MKEVKRFLEPDRPLADALSEIYGNRHATLPRPGLDMEEKEALMEAARELFGKIESGDLCYVTL